MKLIKGVIRSDRADVVLDRLSQAGLLHATLTDVLAVGASVDPDDSRVSMQYGRRVNRMVQIELLCPDRDETQALDLIRDAACTNRPGDGVITVLNINRLTKIRSGEESVDAL